jgi:hypothetical protein
MNQAAAPPVSPKPALWLMIGTYVVGAVGVFIGFYTISEDRPSLSIAALLAVGAGGLLSFVRHSIFHASDAARMGWDLGRRNNFQIEVGLANLAWGLLAILAVTLRWGLMAEAASFLVFGLYLAAVALMLTFTPPDDRTRPWRQVAVMGSYAFVLLWLGFAGMAAA